MLVPRSGDGVQRDRPIKGHEPATARHCQCQEIDVGHLTWSVDTRGIDNLSIQGGANSQLPGEHALAAIGAHEGEAENGRHRQHHADPVLQSHRKKL